MAKEESKDFEGKVDLFTYDEELADNILADYPDAIFPEQYKVDNSGDRDLYCFFDLRELDVMRFLGKHKGREYELRDSKTGEYIHINRLNNH